MKKIIIVLFVTISINNKISGQTNYHLLSSNSFKSIVQKQLDCVKQKLCCDKNDILSDTNNLSIDTALFIYIPILYAQINLSYDKDRYEKFNYSFPTISEVLLLDKKSKKIIGSILIGKNKECYYNFYNYKKYIARMPMRIENRLTYINKKFYHKIEKFLIHHYQKGYFFTIENIESLFFILENNDIITVYSVKN